MVVIQMAIHNKGNCHCSNFLAPVTTWKELAERHDQSELFSSTLVKVSDSTEDWLYDIFQCWDCGRYWIREDVGLPWITRSYAFFYYMDTSIERVAESLKKPNSRPLGRVIDRLDKTHPDFKTLIAPNLELKI